MGPTRDFWTVACSLPCRCNQLFSLEPHASRPFRETPQQHSSVRGKPAIVTETNKEKQQPNRENTNKGQPRTFSDWNSQIVRVCFPALSLSKFSRFFFLHGA